MSYDFNGSNQRLDANLTISNSPYTFHIWLNRDISSNHVAIMALRNNDGSIYSAILPLNAANGNYVRFQVSDPLAVFAVTTQAISTGSWTSLGARQTSSTSRKVYLNGTHTATNTENKNPTSLNKLLIGCGSDGNAGGPTLANYTDGKIAEVAVWNVDLSDDEMISLSKGLRASKIRPQSLVFYAPLVRNLIDAKGGLTITNNNSATVADHPRIYG